MVLRVTIKMENDAFCGGNSGNEVDRILRELGGKLAAKNLDGAKLDYPLFDINGNKVGQAKTAAR
jgi:hypothetical protein